MSSIPGAIDYMINWHVIGLPQARRTTKVVIIPGYSTLDDADKIIAIASLGSRDLVHLVVVDSATEL